MSRGTITGTGVKLTGIVRKVLVALTACAMLVGAAAVSASADPQAAQAVDGDGSDAVVSGASGDCADITTPEFDIRFLFDDDIEVGSAPGYASDSSGTVWYFEEPTPRRIANTTDLFDSSIQMDSVIGYASDKSGTVWYFDNGNARKIDNASGFDRGLWFAGGNGFGYASDKSGTVWYFHGGSATKFDSYPNNTSNRFDSGMRVRTDANVAYASDTSGYIWQFKNGSANQITSSGSSFDRGIQLEAFTGNYSYAFISDKTGTMWRFDQNGNSSKLDNTNGSFTSGIRLATSGSSDAYASDKSGTVWHFSSSSGDAGKIGGTAGRFNGNMQLTNAKFGQASDKSGTVWYFNSGNATIIGGTEEQFRDDMQLGNYENSYASDKNGAIWYFSRASAQKLTTDGVSFADIQITNGDGYASDTSGGIWRLNGANAWRVVSEKSTLITVAKGASKTPYGEDPSPAEVGVDGSTYKDTPVCVVARNTGENTLSGLTFDDDTKQGGDVTGWSYTITDTNGTVKQVDGSPIKDVAYDGTKTEDVNKLKSWSLKSGEVVTFTGTLKGTDISLTNPHSDEVSVSATGEQAGTTVEDSDAWAAEANGVPAPAPDDSKFGYTKSVAPEGDGYRISLTASNTDWDVTPPSSDIAILLDTSDSMNKTMDGSGGKSRMDVAKETVNSFADQMLVEDTTQIALIPFSNLLGTVTNFTPDATTVTNAVNSITAAGGNNYKPAFETANSLLSSRSTQLKYMILATDGTSSYTNAEVNAAKQAIEDNPGLKIFAIGVGPVKAAANTKDFMERVTDSEDGYFAAADQDALNNAFAEIRKQIVVPLVIHDALSEYVDYDDGFTVTDGSGNAIPSDQYTSLYDSETKELTVTFNGSFVPSDNTVYTVSFLVKPSQTADDYYDAHGQYPHTGDAGTGATSAGKPGFYSNTEATVQYNDAGTTKSFTYSKPVIQLKGKVPPDPVDPVGESSVTVDKSRAKVTNNPDGATATIKWDVTVTNKGNKLLTEGKFTDRLSNVATDVKVETLMGDMFAPDTVGPYLPTNSSVFILTDSSGKPWRFNPSDYTVAAVTGAENAKFAPNLIGPGFGNGSVFVLADEEGTLWQITNGGAASKVTKENDNDWTNAKFKPNLVGPELSKPEKSGETPTYKMFMLTDENGTLWKIENDGDDKTLPKKVETADGAIFVRNLVSPRFNGKSSFVLTDTSGKLWQVKDGSMARVESYDSDVSSQTKWNSASFKKDQVVQRLALNTYQASFVLTDTSGNLWRIRGDGKATNVSGLNSNVTFAPDLVGPYLEAGYPSFVLSDNSGVLWKITNEGQASRVTSQNGAWNDTKFEAGLVGPGMNDNASFVLSDKDGGLWVIASGGVASRVTSTDADWDTTTFASNLIAKGLSLNNGSFVLSDDEGVLWRVSNGGVASKVTSDDGDWNSTSFVPNKISPGLAGNNAFVLTDSAAIPWLVTGNGMASRMRGATWEETWRALEEIEDLHKADVDNGHGDKFTERVYSIPNIPAVLDKDSRVLRVTATVPRPIPSDDPLVIANQALYSSKNTPLDMNTIDLPTVPDVQTARDQLDGLEGNDSCPVGPNADAPCDQVPAVIDVQPIHVVMTGGDKTGKTPAGQEPKPVSVGPSSQGVGYADTEVKVTATNTSESGSGVELKDLDLKIEKQGETDVDLDPANWTWSTSTQTNQPMDQLSKATLGPGESITFTGNLPGANLTSETLYTYKAIVSANKISELPSEPSDSDTWAAKTVEFSGELPYAGAFPWMSATGIALLTVGTLTGSAYVVVWNRKRHSAMSGFRVS